MPLYLVRWPNLDLALVRADDEDHLKNILDEVSDPACATWQVYRGPLYIGFKSLIELKFAEPEEDAPLTADDVELKGVGKALRQLHMHDPEVQEALDTETGAAMYNTFVKKAFPHIYRVMERMIGSSGKKEAEALKQAAMKELEPLFAYSRRAHEVQSGDDPASQLLKQMGLVELTPSMQESIQQAMAEEETKRKVKRIRERPDAPSPRPRDGQRAKLPGGRRRG